MTSIQVADQTFIAAPPESATAVISDRANWRRWWPDLRLTVVQDRKEQGVRWKVSGPVEGTTELWLERVLDGFVLHYFLHAEPTGTLPAEPRARGTELARMIHRRRVAGRAMSFEVKDRLEQSRHVGGPAVGAPAAGGSR